MKQKFYILIIFLLAILLLYGCRGKKNPVELSPGFSTPEAVTADKTEDTSAPAPENAPEETPEPAPTKTPEPTPTNTPDSESETGDSPRAESSGGEAAGTEAEEETSEGATYQAITDEEFEQYYSSDVTEVEDYLVEINEDEVYEIN